MDNDDPVEHEMATRIDWEGDPGVINGTRSWEVEYCAACGAEGDELAGPCDRPRPDRKRNIPAAQEPEDDDIKF